MGELHNTGEIHASRNTIKMANITHLKYVDDLILAETQTEDHRQVTLGLGLANVYKVYN